MATALPPPPRKEDQRFDNWVFTLWKRAVAALVSGGVGATAPITITTAGTGTVNIGHGTSGVVTGTYGSQSSIPILAVDTYGHITIATSSAVAISGTNITGADLTVNTPLLGTVTNALLRAGAISHATSGIVTGTYGAASVIPQVVVNTWGHVTAINTLNVAVSGTAVTGADLTVNSPLQGTVTNALLRAGAISHAVSGVTAASYGNGGNVAQVTVDTYGHITAASSVAISNAPGNFTVGGTTAFVGVGSSAPGFLNDGTYGAAIFRRDAVRHFGVRWDGTTAEFMDASANNVSPSAWNGTKAFTINLVNGALNAGTNTIHSGFSGVVTGTYGGATVIPQVVVNTYGHITAINTFGVSFPNLVTSAQNGAYTLGTADVNNLVYRDGTATGLATWTVPSTLGTGALVTLINDGTGNVTVTAVGTLVFAGTGATGDRTLPQYGMASVVSVGTSRWYISGAGVF